MVEQETPDYFRGTLAERPAASRAAETYYFAHDVRELHWSTGAAWVQLDTVGGGGAGGPATVSALGNLGATEAINTAGADRAWYTGTLDSAVSAITITNMGAGDEVVLELTQDGTGGRRATVDIGGVVTELAIDTEPAAQTVVVIRYDGAAATIVSSAGGSVLRINSQTANYTLVLTDAGKVVEMSNAASRTITVPPNSSVAFPIGTVVECSRMGAGAVALVAGAGVTIRSKGGVLGIADQYTSAALRKRATDEWVAVGNLA